MSPLFNHIKHNNNFYLSVGAYKKLTDEKSVRARWIRAFARQQWQKLGEGNEIHPMVKQVRIIHTNKEGVPESESPNKSLSTFIECLDEDGSIECRFQELPWWTSFSDRLQIEIDWLFNGKLHTMLYDSKEDLEFVFPPYSINSAAIIPEWRIMSAQIAAQNGSCMMDVTREILQHAGPKQVSNFSFSV
jgi:hypothetical protein